LFLNTLINFLIVAFVVFMLIRAVNKATSMGEEKAPEDPTTKDCPYCKSSIAIEATRCPNCTSQLETA
jgi:large conductance mechanosensitive channel